MEEKEIHKRIQAATEMREALRFKIDDVLGKYVELKRHNRKLKVAVNSRLLREQTRRAQEKIELKKELDSHENELRAALRANKTLRREVTRREVRMKRTDVGLKS